MPKEGVDKTEREVNDFHSEWMNSFQKRAPSNIGPKRL